MRPLVIATRRSPLALWQANHVLEKIRQQDPRCEVSLLPLVTSGDRASQGLEPISGSNGKGLFVKELEEALLDRRADFAVHSIKDVPAVFPDGLGLTTLCKRGNPFDAFVSSHYPDLDALPLNARIGTASLRRQSQLLAYRPDLQISVLRGNVQTRLTKLHEGHFDAIILAAAGLERLGLASLIRAELTPPLMIPACGQGAIGIECRLDDHALIHFLSAIHCEATAICVQTERRVNEKLGGNCQVPVAVFCTQPVPHQLHLQARVLNARGDQVIESTQVAASTESEALATQCVDHLMQQGAKALLSLSL